MSEAQERAIGICLGASNVKIVELAREPGGAVSIVRRLVRNHESNPRRVFRELVDELALGSYELGVLTGRKFRGIVNAASITEAEAIEQALALMRVRGAEGVGANVLVSLGAESFIAYMLTADGHISSIETGNKCASGTGEFFKQQIRRMDISTAEAVRLATDSEEYAVSGRCSVFCKSDCTHALNKGVPIGRVTAGLCQMMAEKVVDLLEKSDRKDVIAVGGVTANRVVMDRLRARVDRLVIPEDAECFEALGAAYHALVGRVRLGLGPAGEGLFRERATSFTFLPPIRTAAGSVDFKPSNRGAAEQGDRCVVGLDVGSTTTKSVVLRLRDDSILASIYLRTNGDPVGASRRCYREMASQLEGVELEIVGLGVTGSGRYIAGLHAGTDEVINEIVAHATGAAHFDPRVDTIFEIGGQDAKYTHLTNAVPSDYAMNEACSAGTGSFLEESAQESLGIDYREIERIALLGERPPNFNDQCAAFISSDIKTATHEGIGREDVVAGLVYSICMNYTNRVKGQRPVGDTIFMQGGVCYNRAVPLAMANLIERRIVVPPDPGLIGAFGVALEVKNRIAAGLTAERRFDVRELADREIGYGRSFRCKGGKDRCDRGCEIAMTIVGGRRIPFGGACNRYYNRRHRIANDTAELDLVRRRQETNFSARRREAPRARPARRGRGVEAPIRVGLSRSYLVNTYHTLFHTFFTELGCAVVLADRVDPDGVKKRRSSFCYPGEIAHGFFQDLLKKDPDFIFLPKVMSQQVKNAVHTARERQSTCVLLQSEAYYLRSTFKNVAKRAELIAPILDFAGGLDAQPCVETFVSVARQLGRSRRQGLRAYRRAVDAQLGVVRQVKAMGRRALAELERTPERTAVVVFGRSYNAFASEANMGIPTKFASRGVMTIPWDALPFEGESCDDEMCWAVGQELLKAAAFVERHPQLFGAWVTNFSCGPDSFLVGYFRDIMKTKPSLTLELDSHTADAGVNTRVEAFLDIVQRYRSLGTPRLAPRPFTPARMRFGDRGVPIYVTSDGEEVSFLDRERVHLLIPSMGELGSEILAAAFNGIGVRSDPVPVYTFEDLKLGRANASCKECLPLQLVVGGLLQYLERRTDEDELLAYFMPFTPGNCRFPQYRVFIDSIIEKRQLRNVTQFSLNAEKGYSYKAFGTKERIAVLKAFIVSDVMEDIRNALAVLAVDREEAARVFDAQWARVVAVFADWTLDRLEAVLDDVSAVLRRVPLERPLSEARKVALVGEIFVRRDYFSAAELMDRLIANGIVVKKAHFFEWLQYVDAIIKRGIYEPNFSLVDKVNFEAKVMLQHRYEKQLKSILARSGLYEYEVVDLPKIFEYGTNFFDVRFRGESMLVVGGFFKDILHGYHGLVNIGPFACMPTRVIESVMSSEATLDVKRRLDGASGGGAHADGLEGVVELPILTIETDGNPMPQILEARIEAFCLQVDRLHGQLEEHRRNHPTPAPAPSLVARAARALGSSRV
jgi:predicted CoA-substrate-specific enzyme activase